MTGSAERRLLQIVITLAAIVPIAMGLMSIVRGPAVLSGMAGSTSVDLDSHFRYLSGLLLGVGLGFMVCIPRIERRGTMVRLLGAIVIVGGLARLLSLAIAGTPGPGHLFGLAMELVIVPLILLWQARIAKRFSDQVI